MIFESEEDLLSTLDKHDQLILDCANERMPFWQFCEQYHNFYHFYALDGHESDEEEFKILLKNEERLKVHAVLTNEVLNKVCSDEDAKRPIYIENGRFGSDIGLLKLKEIATKYLKKA